MVAGYVVFGSIAGSDSGCDYYDVVAVVVITMPPLVLSIEIEGV